MIWIALLKRASWEPGCVSAFDSAKWWNMQIRYETTVLSYYYFCFNLALTWQEDRSVACLEKKKKNFSTYVALGLINVSEMWNKYCMSGKNFTAMVTNVLFKHFCGAFKHLCLITQHLKRHKNTEKGAAFKLECSSNTPWGSRCSEFEKVLMKLIKKLHIKKFSNSKWSSGMYLNECSTLLLKLCVWFQVHS